MKQRRTVHVQKRGRELRLTQQHDQSCLEHVPSPRYLCWGVLLPPACSEQRGRTDRGAWHQGNIFSRDEVQRITRMSTSIIEPAVTRAGRHLPAPAAAVVGEKGGCSGSVCSAPSWGGGSRHRFSVCKVKFLKVAALVIVLTQTVVAEHFWKSLRLPKEKCRVLMMIECIISNYKNPGIGYFPFLPSFWYNWKQEDIHKRNIVSVSNPFLQIFAEGSERTNWNNPTDFGSLT